MATNAFFFRIVFVTQSRCFHSSTHRIDLQNDRAASAEPADSILEGAASCGWQRGLCTTKGSSLDYLCGLCLALIATQAKQIPACLDVSLVFILQMRGQVLRGRRLHSRLQSEA